MELLQLKPKVLKMMLKFLCHIREQLGLSGLEITDNGILLTTNRRGRASGEGYVQFASSEHLELALQRDRQNIGSRWVGLN